MSQGESSQENGHLARLGQRLRTDRLIVFLLMLTGLAVLLQAPAYSQVAGLHITRYLQNSTVLGPDGSDEGDAHNDPNPGITDAKVNTLDGSASAYSETMLVEMPSIPSVLSGNADAAANLMDPPTMTASASGHAMTEIEFHTEVPLKFTYNLSGSAATEPSFIFPPDLPPDATASAQAQISEVYGAREYDASVFDLSNPSVKHLLEPVLVGSDRGNPMGGAGDAKFLTGILPPGPYVFRGQVQADVAAQMNPQPDAFSQFNFNFTFEEYTPQPTPVAVSGSPQTIITDLGHAFEFQVTDSSGEATIQQGYYDEISDVDPLIVSQADLAALQTLASLPGGEAVSVVEINVTATFQGPVAVVLRQLQALIETLYAEGQRPVVGHLTQPGQWEFLELEGIATSSDEIRFETSSFSPFVLVGLPAGDFDNDGLVDAEDIDALAAAALAGATDLKFDVNRDGVVDFSVNPTGTTSDSDYLVREILGTEYGDANLDGKIDILDLDLLGQDYNDKNASLAGWLFGDFDGDGTTGIADLDLLGQNYGFTAPTPLVAVPEPTSWALVCLSALLVSARRFLSCAPPQSLALQPIAKGSTFVAVSLLVCAAAHANLVVTDSLNRATVTVSDAPSPVTGFVTYTFSITPFLSAQEVTSIDASFVTSGPEMRQVNPSSAVTVFNDFNLNFGSVGEDTSGLGDSQFRFSSTSLLVGSQSEGNLSLAAAFTGFTPIQSDESFAHVVLPEGESGTFNLEAVVRNDGVTGLGDIAQFSNVQFGVVAVPEAGQVAAGGLLLAAGSLWRLYARQERHSNMSKAATH